MKHLILVAALGVAALASSAQASTATGNFNVGITLTSSCEVSTAPTANFTYTSFQATAATIASSFTVRCTNTLPISSIALDNAGSYTDAATNLAYTLSLAGVPTAGTGVAQTVNLSGSMAASQAGTCATASCTNGSSANKQRTITITY